MPPNFDKVWVDASEEGFGVIVEQNNDDGIPHPIAYASRATNDAKKKYPTTKFEMAVIVFALNHFTWYTRLQSSLIIKHLLQDSYLT